jgi:hypothetical protein
LFEHHALNAAAERLATLRSAASAIGAQDPIAALQHLDCDPAAIRESAARVDSGREALARAHTEFRDGTDRAETAWDDAGAFGEHADAIDLRYRAALAAAARTTEAGRRIADHLDTLAAEAATDVITVAGETEAAAALVLSGDRSPEAIAAVDNACARVIRAVMAHVAAIPEAGAELETPGRPAT